MLHIIKIDDAKLLEKENKPKKSNILEMMITNRH